MVAANQMKTRARQGFSLIELVVVVLVMGIIAAVAGPKMFDTASDAKLSATKQSLAVLRDAIELYKAQTGSYPTASISTELAPYLRGPFPKVETGANAGSDAVRTHSGSPTPTGTQGWAYDTTSGAFIINDTTNGLNLL